MKILYDHQIFSTQIYGGVSRYFCELINECTKTDGIETDLSVSFSNNHYIGSLSNFKYSSFFPTIRITGKNRLQLQLNKLFTIRKLKKGDFDVFHPTYYDPYFIKYLQGKPYIVTVYDMIHEKFDEFFSENSNLSKNKRLVVENASKVIAISENTKQDLINLYGIDGSKIEVVYLCDSINSQGTSELPCSLPQKYILFVGTRGAYKNFNRFIQAVSILIKADNTLFVVCVGGGEFNDKDITRFDELGIADNVLQFTVDDNDLFIFYKNALMFVFPSLYEGFGIPVLEAFACDCPLVCSNTSSLPEIAGNAALYFDPYDEESIYDGIKTMLEDKELRTNIASGGAEQMKKFSWKKTAEKTKIIYESII